jgi:trans-L-3-hydroxyproline dehydratase
MCGHGVIGLVTALLETGALDTNGAERTVKLDTPAGRVTARARLDAVRAPGTRVHSVAFENVPAFVAALDHEVELPGFGAVRCDVAFGGAFYAYCQASDLRIRVVPEAFRALIDLGTAVKRAVIESLPLQHPVEPDLAFLYGTIISEPAAGADAALRNVCVFADGEVDRSPTGTGVSGRLALEYARGRLMVGERFGVESIVGTRFLGRILRTTQLGGCAAIIPEVEGSASLTGRHEFVVDPADPLRGGFMLR